MNKYLIVFNLILLSAFCWAQEPQEMVAKNPQDVSPLLIGEQIPNAVLINPKGEQVKLKDYTDKKSTVLVFYRGSWCPFCNLQLMGLGEVQDEIVKMGYQIVAVSPDDYLNLAPILEEDNLSYTVLSDKNSELIKKVGIAFWVDGKTHKYLSRKTKGKATNIIPVPTVMVLNQDREVLFEYINPNYKTRLSSDLLLAVLKALKKE